MSIPSKTFSLSVPTRIYYGRNVTEKALAELQQTNQLDGKILLVTTGGSLYRYGYINRITDLLKETADVAVFDGISANPKLQEVEQGVLIAKDNNVSAVVGFGGGSAMDAAKAIAAGAVSQISITKLFRQELAPKKSLPVIAMPTTAGTGSELSKAAILEDEQMQIKNGLRGDAMFPVSAIVDSSFTDSVPFSVTMETGFDVIAHATESYISNQASPLSEMLSEYVLKHAGYAIRSLIQDLTYVKARDVMSYCSMIMGINLGNTGTALPHRMQYPIGAHTNSSHGAGLAALYPDWIRYENEMSPDKVNQVLEWLHISDFEELIKDMGLNRSLKDLGIEEDRLNDLSTEIRGNIGNDPASQIPNVIEKIYRQSWEK